MNLEYIHTDGRREAVGISIEKKISLQWLHINTSNKLEFLKVFIPAYLAGQKLVLFDPNHKQLVDFYEKNNINNLDGISAVNDDCQLLFFTSGSNGFPLGAFKTKENLEKEIKVLSDLVTDYDIKKIVVTVPFVHIYGVLAGLLLPIKLNVKLIVKEDFLPYELLEEADDKNTLVVTTPVFIKALSQLNAKKDMSSNLFICSTGPLHNDNVKAFENKFQANLLQLFGSTETGGIAYKFHSSDIWKPLDGVKLTRDEGKLKVSSPFVSKHLIDKDIYISNEPFQTEDLIEIKEDGFTLIGRSNKIIKIAGKRISATKIEDIIESIKGVKKVIVEVIYKKELLRSEQILITMEADRQVPSTEIKHKISEYYGTLTIPFTISCVEKIDHSAMGKKVIFNKSEETK